MTAIATIAGIIAGILNGGCGTIKSSTIASDMEEWTGRARAVCTSVELFHSVGLDAPGIEQCKRAIKAIDSEYYAIIYDVATCAQDNKPNSQEFAICVASVESWEPVAQKIASEF